MSAMWRTMLASLRGHRRRALSTATAVILGVAFLAGTLVLSDTLRSGFGGIFAEANEGTDAVVRSATRIGFGDAGQAGTLDGDLVGRFAEVDGVAAAVPFVESAAQLVGADGNPLGGSGPPTVAGNWVPDERLNPYRLVEGRAPERPGEVVIDRRSAREGDLEVGSRTVVRVPEPVDVTVVGIAGFGEKDSLSGVTFAAFTTEVAQELLLPQPGKVNAVRVTAAEGVEQDELVRRLEAVLPPDAEALTGEALTAEQERDIESEFLGVLETALLAFAGIALVVATFSIYNTFSVVVAQRTRESALLRALGASRRQVLGSVLTESALLGLVASAVGIVAGIGLSWGLTAWMDASGFALPTSDLVISWSSMIVALVVGLVVTVVAGLVPAVRAARVRPLAALREVAVDRQATARGRAVAGAVALIAGAGLVLAGATGGDLGMTGLGSLVLLVGMVLAGPVVARPVAAVLGAPLARLRGVSGNLARANAMRNPSRTAGTASALMVGVAVVAMFTVVAASLKTYVDDAVHGTVRAELVIAVDDFGAIGLDPSLTAEVAELTEVDEVAALALAPVRVDGRDRWAEAVDGPALDRLLDLEVTHGSLTDLVDGGIALSERDARGEGLALGSTVAVAFPDGHQRDLQVVALYGNREIVGDVLVPAATWADHATQVDNGLILVGVAAGTDTDEARVAVQEVVDRFAGPAVQDREEFVQRMADEVDQLLTVVYVLLALAVLIALMSIGTTLSLSIHERTRELGLLRAVGQTRRQLRTMVRGEALTVALFGTLGGLGLGAFLGWGLMRALAEAEDVAAAFELPVTNLVVVTALGGLVGLLAAARPARRAARLDVLAAITRD